MVNIPPIILVDIEFKILNGRLTTYKNGDPYIKQNWGKLIPPIYKNGDDWGMVQLALVLIHSENSHGSCNGASFDGLASCPGVNIQKYVENPWGTRKGTSLRNMIHIYGGENRIFLHVYRVFTTIVGRFHFSIFLELPGSISTTYMVYSYRMFFLF